ncbi:MAG: pilin, partial [Chromatiales bacterium]|nr:pilin [Chromatiales bacterium]
LAGIAIPAYQDYTIRSQITEALTLATELKPGIKEYYKHKGVFPANNEQAGAPEAKYLLGNYVQGIEVADGAIHVSLGNKINQHLKDKKLTLRPIVVTGSPTSPFSWLCGYDEAPNGMEPIGENRTDIENKFLPPACRS